MSARAGVLESLPVAPAPQLAEFEGDPQPQKTDGADRCQEPALPEPVVGVRRGNRLARPGQRVASGTGGLLERAEIERVHSRPCLQQRLIQLAHRAGKWLDVEALLRELHLVRRNLRPTRAQFVQRRAEARGGLVADSVVPGVLGM